MTPHSSCESPWQDSSAYANLRREAGNGQSPLGNSTGVLVSEEIQLIVRADLIFFDFTFSSFHPERFKLTKQLR